MVNKFFIELKLMNQHIMLKGTTGKEAESGSLLFM